MKELKVRVCFYHSSCLSFKALLTCWYRRCDRILSVFSNGFTTATTFRTISLSISVGVKVSNQP